MNFATRANPPATPETSPVSARQPAQVISAVMGLNTNITVQGVVFHIQTEDLGPKHAQVVTHVFADGGRVVKVARVDYSQHVGNPDLRASLPRAMKAHHRLVARKLEGGELDAVAARVTLAPPVKPSRSNSVRPPRPLSLVPQSFPPVSQPVASVVSISTLPASTLPASAPGASVRSISIPPASAPVFGEVLASVVPRSVDPAEVDAARIEPARIEPARVERATEPADAARAAESEPPTGARGAPKPAAQVWNQLVEAARRDRGRGAWNHGPASAEGAAPLASASTRRGAAEAVDPGSPATDHYQSGVRLMKEGAILEALVRFAQAVQLDPRNSRFLRALRRCLDVVDAKAG